MVDLSVSPVGDNLEFSAAELQERLLVEDALHHPWIVSLAQSSQNVPLPVTLMANLKVRGVYRVALRFGCRCTLYNVSTH